MRKCVPIWSADLCMSSGRVCSCFANEAERAPPLCDAVKRMHSGGWHQKLCLLATGGSTQQWKIHNTTLPRIHPYILL